LCLFITASTGKNKSLLLERMSRLNEAVVNPDP
jgi:hypothetical protein